MNRNLGPIVALTIVAVVIILVTLWQYKEIVGLVLLGLLIAGVAVTLCGQLNEQRLRHLRFQHDQETPLQSQPQPHYLRQANECYTYHGPAAYEEEQRQGYSGEPR
jgi:hypothetical protein